MYRELRSCIVFYDYCWVFKNYMQEFIKYEDLVPELKRRLTGKGI